MSRDSFRKSIFDIIEFINRFELSDTAKKLVLHYFNESRQATSYRKAVDSIERYLHDEIPAENDRSPRFRKLLSSMAAEAEKWDSD